MTKNIKEHFIHLTIKSWIKDIYPDAFKTLGTYLDSNPDIYAYSVDEIPMSKPGTYILRYDILCDNQLVGYIMDDLRCFGIK